MKVRFIYSEDKLEGWILGLWGFWSVGEFKYSLLVNVFFLFFDIVLGIVVFEFVKLVRFGFR